MDNIRRKCLRTKVRCEAKLTARIKQQFQTMKNLTTTIAKKDKMTDGTQGDIHQTGCELRTLEKLS